MKSRRFNTNPTALAAGILLLLASPLAAQTQERVPVDRELASHLEALKRKVDDPTTPVSNREMIAAEMAATLDRAAQAAPSADVRLERWREAIDVLDRFTKDNPRHPSERQFAVQAAVYLWASARTGMDLVRDNPGNTKAQASARDALIASVNRLRPVIDGLGLQTADVFAQNARYRLAQSLGDLADMAGPDDATRLARSRDALARLSPPITEPSLQGFAHLLRANLLTKLDRPAEALAEIDAAAKSSPPPPEADLLEARVAFAIAQRSFGDIARTIDAAKVDATAKPLIKIRALIAERSNTSELKQRSAAESGVFRELKTLKETSRPEARAALMASATAIIEPDDRQPPFAWDLLAEGAVALGAPERGGRLESKGAERAQAEGLTAPAADYRLKAGAYYFQAERFEDADALLSRVAEDKTAGSARPKAALLRSLARGRALAKNGKASPRAYVEALVYQVKNFPEDPSTAEARWLLGQIRLASSDRADAETLWAAIPPASPRWLDARLQLARLHQSDIDAQRLNNDRPAIQKTLDEARTFLARSVAEAPDGHATHQLQLASARLELSPGLGRSDSALRTLDQLQKSISNGPDRDEARRLKIVALAQSNRFVEAEQAARAEVKLTEPGALLETIRLLDRSAAETESDLRMRRMGLILRVFLSGFAEVMQTLSPESRAEARLRHVRALLFSGDDEGARRAMTSWTEPPPSSGPEVLRDLAETYGRLGLFLLAEDVHRLRAQRSATGSLAWFDARYGLALAYFREGKMTDALHLIDATAILHPDLGGGDLREKFIKLRQRLDAKD